MLNIIFLNLIKSFINILNSIKIRLIIYFWTTLSRIKILTFSAPYNLSLVNCGLCEAEPWLVQSRSTLEHEHRQRVAQAENFTAIRTNSKFPHFSQNNWEKAKGKRETTAADFNGAARASKWPPRPPRTPSRPLPCGLDHVTTRGKWEKKGNRKGKKKNRLDGARSAGDEVRGVEGGKKARGRRWQGWGEKQCWTDVRESKEIERDRKRHFQSLKKNFL